MKPLQTQETINKFLVSVLPEGTRTSYELLATLDYPLADYDSLKKATQAGGQDGKTEPAPIEAANSVLARLAPTDFPLVSAQGALEKFHARLQFPDLSRFVPPLWIPPDSVEPPEPDFRRSYRRLFGLRCGDEAYAAYLQARRQGLLEVPAFMAGMNVGRQCV